MCPFWGGLVPFGKFDFNSTYTYICCCTSAPSMKTIDVPSVRAVLRLFNQLGKADRIKVAERIGKQTFEARWDAIDATLPDEPLADEDIMKEVSAVRYGKKS